MSSKQYCLILKHGRPRFYLSSPEGRVFSFADARTSITDGKWHHVRGVRNVADGTVQVFVDGKLEGEKGDMTNGDFACDAPVAVGAYLWGDRTTYARGLLDDVEIKGLGRLVVPGK